MSDKETHISVLQRMLAEHQRKEAKANARIQQLEAQLRACQEALEISIKTTDAAMTAFHEMAGKMKEGGDGRIIKSIAGNANQNSRT